MQFAINRNFETSPPHRTIFFHSKMSANHNKSFLGAFQKAFWCIDKWLLITSNKINGQISKSQKEREKKRFLFFFIVTETMHGMNGMSLARIWLYWPPLFSFSIISYASDLYIQNKYVYGLWVKCVIFGCDLCARVPEQDGNKNHICEYDRATCVTIPKRIG